MWPNVLHNRKMAPLSHLKTLSDKCAWVRKHTHFIISKKKNASVTHLFMQLTPFDYICADMEIALLFTSLLASI